jgi:segregation and condensation protein A
MPVEEKARDAHFVLRIPSFEGPLDLLLYLIEKNRFTLENLEVLPIIEQYLRYMEQARSLDMALAGEFLEMASYLIWLKSCLLLPVSREEADGEDRNPAQELKDMLIAYRAIRQASLDLSNRPMLFRDKFPKGYARRRREGHNFHGPGRPAQRHQHHQARTRQQVLNVATSASTSSRSSPG